MTSSTTSSRTGKGKRAHLSAAQVEAADAARAAKIAALHEQIGEQVQALTAGPRWRAMLDASAKFHTYSLGNQLLIELQAARLGISPPGLPGSAPGRRWAAAWSRDPPGSPSWRRAPTPPRAPEPT